MSRKVFGRPRAPRLGVRTAVRKPGRKSVRRPPGRAVRPRYRMKAGLSKTILTRKLKTRKMRVQGAGGQVSYFKHSVPLSPSLMLMKKNNAAQHWVVTSSQRLTAASNQQGYLSYAYFSGGAYNSTTTDLSYILNKVASQVSNTTVSDITLAANVKYKNLRVLLERAQCKFLMTNQSIANACVTIYDIIARADTSIAPATAWNSGLLDEASSTATYNASNPGATPFASELFCTHYKVIGKTELMLGQGQTHEHLIAYKPNKFFNFTDLADSDTSLRGVTLFTMIVVHGVPDNDQTVQTNVGTSSIALDVVTTKQLSWTYSQVNYTTYDYQNNLPTITTERVMDYGSGAVATNVAA